MQSAPNPSTRIARMEALLYEPLLYLFMIKFGNFHLFMYKFNIPLVSNCECKTTEQLQTILYSMFHTKGTTRTISKGFR